MATNLDYSAKNWIDGNTVYASDMNKIENGISSVTEKANENASSIQSTTENLDSVKESVTTVIETVGNNTTAINSEIKRAKEAELTNQNLISAEAKRAAQAETDIINATGAKIEFVYDSAKYTIQALLKNSQGEKISETTVIDLPIETLVKSLSYDTAKKELVVTLQNGTSSRIAVGTIIEGLASETFVTDKISEEDEAVKQWVENKKYLTTHQSLKDYAKTSEVNTLIDSAKDEVNSNVNSLKDDYEKFKKIVGYPYKIEGLSDLEIELATRYEQARTGKVFVTKHNKFAVDTSPMGTKMQDSVGLTCIPSTDTQKGQDDFMQYLPFQWEHCNYVRDSDDGFARPTTLEGRQDYKSEGNVDVGCVSATFWWKRVDTDDYYEIYMSDMPHPELALVPWVEAVKADGSVMPYYIGSAYYSGNGDDGMPRSVPNKSPLYNQSHNGIITAYQKKGAGYWGCGMEYVLHGIIFSEIKYGTANIQQYAQGCVGFTPQVKCAVAETGAKRVLLAKQDTFYKGCCVSVGIARASDNSVDRGTSEIHSKANRVRVTSIEQVEVDGTNYYALNLDIANTIDTDTNTYVSSMPCITGETDAVIDHYDGSYLSYTNSCHSFRLHGREYLCGQYFVGANAGLLFKDGNWHMVYAPKGMKHNTSLNGYTDVGVVPYNSGTDYWCGDWNCDMASGVAFPSSVGKSNALGCGDMVYVGGKGITEGNTRECLCMGDLGNRSDAGLLSLYCGDGLGTVRWTSSSRD